MDSPSLEILDFGDYYRRFGVEIEVNAFDGRHRPLVEGTLPEGIYYVGNLVSEETRSVVEVAKWHHTHNNNVWVVKPDSSCGMELCSPICKGSAGLESVCRVVAALAQDARIEADDRCSLHVHVEVSDLTQEELGAVLASWVKCEPVFIHSVPPHRKRNRYCQVLGLCDIFEHDTAMTAQQLISKLGVYKYATVNTYHLAKGKRATVEFRIAEAAACRSPEYVRNWVRLLVHFVERTRGRGMPTPYELGNAWSSYLWLEPKDVFDLLGFGGAYRLSPALEETRDWFLSRIIQNTRSNLPGVWSPQATEPAWRQAEELATRLINRDGAHI